MGILGALMGGGNFNGAIGNLGQGLFGGVSDAISNGTSFGDGLKRFGKGLFGGLGNAVGSYFGVGGPQQDPAAAVNQGLQGATGALTDAAQAGIGKLGLPEGIGNSLSDLAAQGLQYGSGQLGDLLSQGLNKMQGVSNAGVAGPQAGAAAGGAPNLPEGAAMVDNGVGNQVVLDPSQVARKKVLM